MFPPPYLGINFTKTLHNDIYKSIDVSKVDLAQPSKVVLVVGAGRGIGRSIALQYAAADVACIIICARTASELDEVGAAIRKVNAGVRVRKCTLDVTDRAQISATAQLVKEEGRLDVMVNNAGMNGVWVPIIDTDIDSYWHTWELHVKGLYMLIRAFIPLMIETAKSHGTIVDMVNTASIGAHLVMAGGSVYQASKLAVLRLSEFVMAEYGQSGVNCVAIHPGAVLTDLTKDAVDYVRDSCSDSPELCGGFVVWLTKGKRTWLNGRYMSANWDVDELEAMKDEIVSRDKLKMRMVL